MDRPTTGELFPTLFIIIDSTYTLPNQLYCRIYFPPIWDFIYSQNTESTVPVNIHCETTTCINLCSTRFILAGHVYIRAILEVVLCRCLIFSYLSLLIQWFPYPISLYRCVSHLLPEIYSAHIIYMYSPTIRLRILCIIYVFFHEFRAF